MIRASHRENGFSLIEVLVATTILGIGIVALLGALSQTANSVAHCREVSLASALAAGKLEEVLCQEEILAGTDGGEFDEPFDRYEWSSEVIESEDEETEKLVTVVVTVTWKRGDKTGSFKLETLKLKEMPSPAVPVMGMGRRAVQNQDVQLKQQSLHDQSGTVIESEESSSFFGGNVSGGGGIHSNEDSLF